MQNADMYAWIIAGHRWYVFNVIGGILSNIRIAGWILHDLWYRICRFNKEEKYIIGKSAKKLTLVTISFLAGLFVLLMNITLVIPAALGIQHLFNKKKKAVRKERRLPGENCKDVKHFYDGILYAVAIDPLLHTARKTVAEYVSAGCKLIDICCGTGALALSLAPHCSLVNGMDHSRGMLEYAEKEKENRRLTNVNFLHADARYLSMYENQKFDFAVLSLTLHEMPPNIRVPVLKEASRIAREIILIDYCIPMPVNGMAMVNFHYEINAGYKHLRNFLDFRKTGGLKTLCMEGNLKIEEERTQHKGTLSILRTKPIRK